MFENATSLLRRPFPRGAVSVVEGHPPRSLQRSREDAGGQAPSSGEGGCGNAHAAVVVRAADRLVDAVLPWLEAGQAAGDLTALSCDEEITELLRSRLGPAAADLVIDPRVSLRGVRPPDAVDA